MTRRHVLRLTSAVAMGNLGGSTIPLVTTPLAAEPRKPFPWIGIKFSATGRVLHCPGNTIICHVDPRGPAAAPLAEYGATLAAQPFAHKFAFTPPSSYHMTIFEGVLDRVRKPGFWPDDLPLTAPLEACHQIFLEKLSGFDLGCEPKFRMRVAMGQENVTGRPGQGVMLTPIDAQEEVKLRGLRDRLADLLKLRQPKHERYRFHTTQTYAIVPLSDAETEAYWVVRREALAALAAKMPILELGAPEFCIFDDMFEFRPRLLLRGQSP